MNRNKFEVRSLNPHLPFSAKNAVIVVDGIYLKGVTKFNMELTKESQKISLEIVGDFTFDGSVEEFDKKVIPINRGRK